MEQRRLLIALVLSAIVIFAYDQLVLSRYRHEPTARPSSPTSSTLVREAKPAATSRPGSLTAPVEVAPEVVVETDDLRVHISTAGGRLSRIELKGFRMSVDETSEPLALVSGGEVLSGTLQLPSGASDAAVTYRADVPSLRIRGEETGEIRLSGDGPGRLKLEKRYAFRGSGYLLNVTASATEGTLPGRIGIVTTPIPVLEERKTGQEHAVILNAGKRSPVLKPLQALLDAPESVTEVAWGGFADQYFLVAAMDDRSPAQATLTGAEGTPIVRVDASVVESTARFAVYAGPKQDDALAAAGHQLDRALDFGWFWFVAVPLLKALRLLHGLFGNYGIAIIVLTTLVKLATIPLTQVTFRNMREMQKIQPQMQKLRERFKDDQVALQKELMELYRRHRVNPFSGCLPMLLQIPIFVGLYNALMYAIELRHAPFMAWINDLSSPDRLMMHVFGYSIGVPVLTLLMGGSMLVQQWMTPAQGDPMQQRMMMFMPLIFTFMFLNFPAGLVLYWLVNNIITITQQYIMMRRSG